MNYLDKFNKAYFGQHKVSNNVRDLGLGVKLSYGLAHSRNINDALDAVKQFNYEKYNNHLTFEPYLSNRDAAVVSDAVNKEIHVIFHGAGGFDGDNKAIKDVFLLKDHTNPDIIAAEETLKRVAAANDKNYRIHVVGYSLGGAKSIHLANTQGHLIDEISLLNPYISNLKNNNIDDAIKINVHSTITDPLTQQVRLAKLNNNTTIHNVMPLAKNEGIISGHDLDNFTSREERSTIAEGVHTGAKVVNRGMNALQIMMAIHDTYDAARHNNKGMDTVKYENPEQHYSKKISSGLNPIMGGSFGEYGWDEEDVPSFLRKIVDPIRSEHSQAEIFADQVLNQQGGSYKEQEDGTLIKTKDKDGKNPKEKVVYTQVMGENLANQAPVIEHQANYYTPFQAYDLSDNIHGFALRLDSQTQPVN